MVICVSGKLAICVALKEIRWKSEGSTARRLCAYDEIMLISSLSGISALRRKRTKEQEENEPYVVDASQIE
jgi:hypothetical protein